MCNISRPPSLPMSVSGYRCYRKAERSAREARKTINHRHWFRCCCAPINHICAEGVLSFLAYIIFYRSIYATKTNIRVYMTTATIIDLHVYVVNANFCTRNIRFPGVRMALGCCSSIQSFKGFVRYLSKTDIKHPRTCISLVLTSTKHGYSLSCTYKQYTRLVIGCLVQLHYYQ